MTGRRPPPDLSKTGVRLRLVRVARGVSMKELAERVGCTVGNLSAYETGRAKISHDNIVAIIDALELDPMEVMFWLAPQGLLRPV